MGEKGKARMLIVEDEGYVLEELKKILENFPQFEVDCGNLASGIRQLLDSNVYDVVITDIYVYSISGLEVLHKVRGKNPSAAVIIITGVDNVDLAEKCLKEGAYNYVIKPPAVYKIENMLKLLSAVKGF
mgnify:CR=1 FL=1